MFKSELYKEAPQQYIDYINEVIGMLMIVQELPKNAATKKVQEKETVIYDNYSEGMPSVRAFNQITKL